jgi:hypothetical protein
MIFATTAQVGEYKGMSTFVLFMGVSLSPLKALWNVRSGIDSRLWLALLSGESLG